MREGERKKRKKKGSEKKEFKSEKLLGGRVTYRCINCVIVGHSGVSKVDKLQHRRKTNKHKCNDPSGCRSQVHTLCSPHLVENCGVETQMIREEIGQGIQLLLVGIQMTAHIAPVGDRIGMGSRNSKRGFSVCQLLSYHHRPLQGVDVCVCLCGCVCGVCVLCASIPETKTLPHLRPSPKLLCKSLCL